MKKINFAILNFPGSNCERDCFYIVNKILRQNCKIFWHNEFSISKVDCIIVPGGFSYGDYLRTGSIASQSRISNALIKFANQGGTVIGICNGFQILTELKLLPGTLIRNTNLKFICKDINLKVNKNSRFTNLYNNNEVIRIPIAHAEGNYYADKKTLKKLKDNDQIIFSYCNENGDITNESNPNGSLLNIAGITNKKGNVTPLSPFKRNIDKNIKAINNCDFLLFIEL